MNSAPHSREAWTNADLAQRTEHTLDFDEGIIEELLQWRRDCPEVVDDEVTHGAVAGMSRLEQLALQTRQEVYHGSGVVRVVPRPRRRQAKARRDARSVASAIPSKRKAFAM